MAGATLTPSLLWRTHIGPFPQRPVPPGYREARQVGEGGLLRAIQAVDSAAASLRFGKNRLCDERDVCDAEWPRLSSELRSQGREGAESTMSLQRKRNQGVVGED